MSNTKVSKAVSHARRSEAEIPQIGVRPVALLETQSQQRKAVYRLSRSSVISAFLCEIRFLSDQDYFVIEAFVGRRKSKRNQ